MGWGNAGEIFDIVARGVVKIDEEAAMDAGSLAGVLASLADHLHGEDWDTCRESVDQWSEFPVVIAGLRLSGCVGGHHE